MSWSPGQVAATGLILAGGEGSRMVASGGPAAKCLVEVAGVSLLERNVHRMLSAGVFRLTVAVGPHLPEVAEAVRGPLARLVSAVGGTIDVFEEERPLGNMGALAHVGGDEDLVTTFADNLTSLPLADLILAHKARRSALTIAVHDEVFRLPYGRASLRNSEIVAFEEKPDVTFSVATGACVADVRTRVSCGTNVGLGLVDVFERARAHALAVHAFRHAHPWVDVNDRDAIGRAEATVRRDPDRFELWLTKPAVTKSGVIARRSDGSLLVRQLRSAQGATPRWGLPLLRVDTIPTGSRSPRTATFDDLDEENGAPVRFRVAELGPEQFPLAGLALVPLAEALCEHGSRPLRRAVALLNGG